MEGSVPPSTPTVDDLRGSTVVVTGVGRPGQVGEVVAAAFASVGARTMLIDRDEKAMDRAAAVGGSAHGFACDLTDPIATGRVAEEIAALSPNGVRAVVHLAGGYLEGSPVADTDPTNWHKLFSINLTTAFIATRSLLPLVRQARGALVYFASAAALPGASVTNTAAYAAAKGGVITLMRAVAAEEKKAGVRANALAPQAIRTEANLSSMGTEKQYVDRETIAAWVLWLASAAAGPISGQVIRIG